MIDLTNITYHVFVLTESGESFDIKNYIENLGWEENENEIAVRSSFTVRNDKTEKGYLSDWIKPGCLIQIFASDGKFFDQEVARGYVESWNTVEQNGETTLKCTNYDELYKLQKSQDNLYFPSGTGTQSAITRILEEHGIPQGEYQGPNATHGKQKFNNQYLSDILLEFLDDAMKKGEKPCIIQAKEGKTSIVPRGSNLVIYVFQVDNIKSISESKSIVDLITRVKVIGQAKDDGKSSVEATLNGLTQYGIRQRIYTRGSDESLSDAKSAAQKILDESGNIVQELSIQSPDVPFLRKGDRIYLVAGTAKGTFYIKGIRHNADAYSMEMHLEVATEETIIEREVLSKTIYEIGDEVNFHGGIHYVSSYPDAKGYPASAGKAKITRKNGVGKAHPWHLIHTDSSSMVYGWVDEGTFD